MDFGNVCFLIPWMLGADVLFWRKARKSDCNLDDFSNFVFFCNTKRSIEIKQNYILCIYYFQNIFKNPENLDLPMWAGLPMEIKGNQSKITVWELWRRYIFRELFWKTQPAETVNFSFALDVWTWRTTLKFWIRPKNTSWFYVTRFYV